MVTNRSNLNRVTNVILVLSCPLVVQAGKFAGGTGLPDDPYQIATAAQLIAIGSDLNLLDKHFVLLKDIDLDPNLPGGRVFTRAVIAPTTGNDFFWKGIAFTGSFDGRGYSIRNLTFQRSGMYFLGLFGNLGRGALVSNLGVEDANLDRQYGWFQGVLTGWNAGRIVRCHATGRVSGINSVGIIAGSNRGEIVDCQASGNASGAGSVGGLVGFNNYGTILNCHAFTTVRVTGDSTIDSHPGGGLAGSNTGGLIVNCWAAGNVSATRGNGLGGLVGSSDMDAVIANCYATGSVSVERSGNNLGGLVGSIGGTISDCYAAGAVSAGGTAKALGGLVGYAYGLVLDSYATGRVSAGQGSKEIGGLAGFKEACADIRACFWDIETSGCSPSAGGMGLTTAQMQDIATFVAAGWDLAGERSNGTADLWLIPEGGGYPLLTVHSSTFRPHELDGNGTPDDPYRISSIEDLIAINHHSLAACYRLEADIDLAGQTWSRPPIRYFGGQFDGAGKIVIKLQIRGGSHLGLFGDLGEGASVANLGVRDANTVGAGIVGLLAGANRGSIIGCWANGSILGSQGMGIMTGWNEGSIRDSYGIGDVTSRWSSAVGGLIGWNFGSVNRCYAATHVSWSAAWFESLPGGLVGLNQGPGWSGLAFLELAPEVTSEIRDSYFLIDSDGGGPDNGFGIPLTYIQIKQQASFVGWDFKNTWTICEGKDCPRLRWEKIMCDQP